MNRIDNVLENIDSIAITGHVHPDGDCIGSCLALYTYVSLNYPKLVTDVYLEEPSQKYSFVKNFDRINSKYDKNISYDLLVCLDCASLERIGEAKKYFDTARLTISIDHHVSNTKFADENYVFPNSSSACEALYGFLDPEKINWDMACALYTGIINDTGVFKYSCTSPETMCLAAALMKYNIPTEHIIDESFFAKSYDENRILGYALVRSVRCFNDQVIYSFISAEKMKEYNVTGKDLEGIVAQLRLTRGVRVAAFIYETGVDEYRLSLRSKDDYDVNNVAAVFGGGGHAKAAGATLRGPVKECMAKLLTEIKKGL